MASSGGKPDDKILGLSEEISMPQWVHIMQLHQRSFTCGHCGRGVGARDGYSTKDAKGLIYICPFCDEPTYFSGTSQIPGTLFGDDVSKLPDEVAKAYQEARRCMSIAAYTSATLMARKLLMHIAVSLGDSAGKSFVQYVEYLSNAGYIPPNGKSWVDHIRKKGNEATHELPQISQSDAEELITFMEMLLRFVYEFPAKMKPAVP